MYIDICTLKFCRRWELQLFEYLAMYSRTCCSYRLTFCSFSFSVLFIYIATMLIVCINIFGFFLYLAIIGVFPDCELATHFLNFMHTLAKICKHLVIGI